MHGSDQEQEPSLSIELGRGAKQSARDDFADDRSSNGPLSFGDENSMYEVVFTPPRTSQRRSDGTLRKEAAVRRATESTRANDGPKRSSNGAKPRAVSDNVRQDPASPQHTSTVNAFNVRSSRFTGSRQVSTQGAPVPTRFTAQGGLEFSNETATATAISATYNASHTNQSFLLPDLPNINELVLGVRKDGTPAAKRTSRSRFTSASHNSHSLTHIPVNGVAVPDDEKAIYASLQILKGRLTQLELENSEAQKRAEQYEAEAINLRSQANVGTRRPDSGLGSDDDDDDETLGPQKSKLQASVQALQDHVSRYERKINVSEAAINQVTEERDALITQISQAYFRHEELAEENGAFRETQANLVAENEELRDLVEKLQNENENVREQLERVKAMQSNEKAGSRRKTSTSKSRVSRRTKREEVDDIAGGPWIFTEKKSNGETSVRSRKEGRTANHESQTTRNNVNESRGGRSERDMAARDIASRIEREIQKLRKEGASQSHVQRGNRQQPQRPINVRSRSRSQHRRSTNDTEHTTSRTSRRTFSAPADTSVSEGDLSATEKDATSDPQHHDNTRAEERAQVEQDLTELSELDFNLAADLRKKLEEEMRSKRAQRGQAAAAAHAPEQDQTGRSTNRRSPTRKSSMKDVTAGADEASGRFSIGGRTIEEVIKTAKTVRVQSPHSSDAIFQSQQPDITDIEDASMLSNTSRRRRRTGSTEGMTSAFIIPDITLQGAQSLDHEKTCIRHNAASCTACEHISAKVDIPTPVPVTDRELEDVTNATIRPAQPPAEALARVIKNLEDEITHLKVLREVQCQAYNRHDPALSRHRRLSVTAEMCRLGSIIDKRSDQVYALYDVLEGQKQQEANMSQEIDESIEVGRKEPADRADEDEFSGIESDELPWEGLSEIESDD